MSVYIKSVYTYICFNFSSGFSSDGNNLVALHPLVRRFATKKKTRDTKESEFVPLKIQENDMSTFKTV